MTCPDIFVLLVYLTWRCGLQGRIAVQMEMRDGIILEVNATCSEFEGTVCSQLLGAHASTTHCNTVSYTVDKGTTSMLKTLKEWAFRGYQAGCGRRVFLKGFFRRFHLSEYGWEIKDGIICPSRLNPGEAVTVCNSSIIYTIYQLCSASDVCRITFIKKGNKKGEERQHNIILQP